MKSDDSEKTLVDTTDLHLRTYAKGELSNADKAGDPVALPLHAIQAVNEAREETSRQARVAEETGGEVEAARLRTESLQLQAAEEAASLAKEGLRELARQRFVQVLSDTANVHILQLAYEFFYQTGDSSSASDVLERQVALSDPDRKSPDTAAAYSNLGFLYRNQGDLDRAEEMCRKALAISEAVGCKEGMARQCGNLGILYKNLGDLDRAEEMYRKSIAINEELGRKEGLAKQYGNLGILYKTRGDIDRAEEMYRKALAINAALGRKEGLAKHYDNLGILYMTKGDIDMGEKVYQKALAINAALGHKENMASDYGNLGILYKTRGDIDRAEEMYQKSLELFKTLHSPHSEVVNRLLVNLQKGL